MFVFVTAVVPSQSVESFLMMEVLSTNIPENTTLWELKHTGSGESSVAPVQTSEQLQALQAFNNLTSDANARRRAANASSKPRVVSEQSPGNAQFSECREELLRSLHSDKNDDQITVTSPFATAPPDGERKSLILNDEIHTSDIVITSETQLLPDPLARYQQVHAHPAAIVLNFEATSVPPRISAVDFQADGATGNGKCTHSACTFRAVYDVPHPSAIPQEFDADLSPLEGAFAFQADSANMCRDDSAFPTLGTSAHSRSSLNSHCDGQRVRGDIDSWKYREILTQFSFSKASVRPMSDDIVQAILSECLQSMSDAGGGANVDTAGIRRS